MTFLMPAALVSLYINSCVGCMVANPINIILLLNTVDLRFKHGQRSKLAMASGKNIWQLKFWQKSPTGDKQIKRETCLKNYQ